MSKQNQEVVSKLIKITILSLLFMAVQFIGGYLAHSVAIWSDAFHLLSDVLAYAISLIAVILSEKKSPPYLSFGWLKAQTLGALLNVIFIYLVTVQLFIEATHRMIKKDKVQEPKYMLITSIFGLICNFIVLSILHNDPNGGHHGCSHHHEHHQHQSHHQHSHNGKPCKGHQLPLDQIQKPNKKCQQAHQKQTTSHNHHTHNNHMLWHLQHKLHQHNHQHQQQHKHHQQEHTHHQHQHKHNEKQHSHNEKGCSVKQQNNNKNEGERDSSDQIIQDTGRNIITSPRLMQHDQIPSLGSDQQIKDTQHNHSTNIKNINLEAAYIHIITDIILSIGVIIAALIIYFLAPQGVEWSPWHLADPFCTYLFSILAIYSTWPILKESLLILLDGCDNPHLLNEIKIDLKRVEGVKQIKDLKIWSLNRGKYYAGVQVKMQKGLGSQGVKRAFSLRGIDCFVQIQHQQLQLSI